MMTKTEYLLICLAEECAELALATAKRLRFGPGSWHPNGNGETNQQQMERELTDVFAVADMLGLTPKTNRMEAKKAKVLGYMARSQELGIVEE